MLWFISDLVELVKGLEVFEEFSKNILMKMNWKNTSRINTAKTLSGYTLAITQQPPTTS